MKPDLRDLSHNTGGLNIQVNFTKNALHEDTLIIVSRQMWVKAGLTVSETRQVYVITAFLKGKMYENSSV